MSEIRFDFNNMFEASIGKRHGVREQEIKAMSLKAKKAYTHLKKTAANPVNRKVLSLEWMQLPFQGGNSIAEIQALGKEIASTYDNVISLGIGGSYLGIKAAQDALCPPYFNEFKEERKGSPRIYCEGNNLDPDTLATLLKNLDPQKTAVVVISKSGETTETKAAFMAVEEWLKEKCPEHYGRQIIAITDPTSGSLRKKVDEAQAKDPLSFRSLLLFKGVGGRYSELNMGLLHLAIMGIDITQVLAGAAAMAKKCSSSSLLKNPALLYAVLHTILYKKKKKPIGILMPFSETLKSTADWYVQLLAESTGKKYAREIKRTDGLEQWINDKDAVVNVGRTPVATRGTNDLHSIQQNNIEGENDKVVTFIRVERFQREITLPATNDILSGRRFSELMGIAQEATEWALVQESRPNCTIILPEISCAVWGALLFFFEMATAYEGELLNINAYDQPGVEGYKNYLYYKLGKQGLFADVVEKIKKTPLVKKRKFIL